MAGIHYGRLGEIAFEGAGYLFPIFHAFFICFCILFFMDSLLGFFHSSGDLESGVASGVLIIIAHIFVPHGVDDVILFVMARFPPPLYDGFNCFGHRVSKVIGQGRAERRSHFALPAGMQTSSDFTTKDHKCR
eukprot:scaffold24258_cov47-Attheya_sp.AAC.2